MHELARRKLRPVPICWPPHPGVLTSVRGRGSWCEIPVQSTRQQVHHHCCLGCTLRTPPSLEAPPLTGHHRGNKEGIREEHCRGISEKTPVFLWGTRLSAQPWGGASSIKAIHRHPPSPPGPARPVLVQFKAQARAPVPKTRRWRPRHWESQRSGGGGSTGDGEVFPLLRTPGTPTLAKAGGKPTLLDPSGPHAPPLQQWAQVKVCSGKLRELVPEGVLGRDAAGFHCSEGLDTCQMRPRPSGRL